MKDQEARRNIDLILECLERIETKVRHLENITLIDTPEDMKEAGAPMYPYGRGIRAGPIDEVVQLILNHLGLELHYVPCVDSKHILRRKPQTKKGDKQ